MRKLIIALLFGGLVMGSLAPSARTIYVSAGTAHLASASEVIQLVNQLRAANGLAPYRVDRALMAAAQAHSEYQAANGITSHSGKGGSRPRDRAVASGYGGGAVVYISENIASGTSLTASQAVGWWQGDNLHLTTMISSRYTDVGAGVAEADGIVYYTLDVGYVAGQEGQPPAAPPNPGGSPAGGSGENPTPAGTPLAAVFPIQVATPRPDGSIVHEVQPGQALWNIAAVYEVGLSYLMMLNNLSESALIYPGDKLLIRPPDPTPVPEFSPTPSVITPEATLDSPEAPSPTPTRKTATPQLRAQNQLESRTPTPKVISQAAVPPAAIDEKLLSDPPALADLPRKRFDPILILIGGLVVLGTSLLVFGSLLGRRR